MPSDAEKAFGASITMTTANSNQIRALAKQAKVCGLDHDDAIPPDLRQIIAIADRDQRLLTKDELLHCCRWSGTDPRALVNLQEELPALVDRSRSALLKDEPALVKPGGKLHPQERADACWRDCFHFLRVSLYGIALKRTEITDREGMVALAELYALLDVPVPALLRALSHLRHHSTRAYAQLSSNNQAEALGETLDHISNTIRNVMKRHEGTIA